MYGNGLGIDANPIEAFALWTLAAETGEKRAAANLAKLKDTLSVDDEQAGHARVAALRENYPKLAARKPSRPTTPTPAVTSTPAAAPTKTFSTAGLPKTGAARDDAPQPEIPTSDEAQTSTDTATSTVDESVAPPGAPQSADTTPADPAAALAVDTFDGVEFKVESGPYKSAPPIQTSLPLPDTVSEEDQYAD